ncbi:MAG TPA: SGNH/GDSL hydrolase family protein, partial [Solirubrobacterales bacterium]
MRRAVTVLVVCVLFPAQASADSDSDWMSAPIVPHVNHLRERLQEKLAAGEEKGLAPDVFAKLGDSITASPNFLSGLACGDEVLGNHEELADTIAYFNQTLPASDAVVGCGTATPWSRASASAKVGGVSDWEITGGGTDDPRCRSDETPLHCEYRQLHPAIALVMFGTNDLAKVRDVARFSEDLDQITGRLLSKDVIPILYTVPPRLDSEAKNVRVPSYNAAIFEVAQERRVPLVNFWQALEQPSVMNQGIGPDGIHPSAGTNPVD